MLWPDDTSDTTVVETLPLLLSTTEVVHELIDKTAAKRQLINWAILLWWVTVNSVDLKVQNICIDNSYTVMWCLETLPRLEAQFSLQSASVSVSTPPASVLASVST